MSGEERATPRAGGVDAGWLLVGLVLLACAVYVLSNGERQNFYNHFVWQADAFLHGRFAIEWPVSAAERFPYNDYFQDVYPLTGQPGLALLPFPPLPALLLLPLVAVFGLAADAALFAALVGAVNVGLTFRLASRLTDDLRVALLATFFYGFGTVAWYAAMLGSTWFLAHLVASSCLLLAVGLALDGERAGDCATPTGRLDRRQVVAGFVFGLAVLARLTTVFGAPFFALVGAGGSLRHRAVSAGLGAAVPVAGLLIYNLAASGQVFHPAYDYLYRTEYSPRPELIHQDWAAEDPRYVPQNLAIMLAWPPEIRAECGALLFDPECPLLRPDPLGMSLLLSSPAWLLALVPLLREGRRRIVLGAVLASSAIALVNLAHFSQGWVQFGYRFSNDFAPFALVLATLGIARLGPRPVVLALVAASIVINAWGVYWGVTLGW